jgi:hypothetical protein
LRCSFCATNCSLALSKHSCFPRRFRWCCKPWSAGLHLFACCIPGITFADGTNPLAAPLVQLTPFSSMEVSDGQVPSPSAPISPNPGRRLGSRQLHMHSFSGTTAPRIGHPRSQAASNSLSHVSAHESEPQELLGYFHSRRGEQRITTHSIHTTSGGSQVLTPSLYNALRDLLADRSGGCDSAGLPGTAGEGAAPVLWQNVSAICGFWMTEIEVVEADLIGPQQRAASANDCKLLCEDADGCNAVTFNLQSHVCVFKNVTDSVKLTYSCPATSQLMCARKDSEEPGTAARPLRVGCGAVSMLSEWPGRITFYKSAWQPALEPQFRAFALEEKIPTNCQNSGDEQL